MATSFHLAVEPLPNASTDAWRSWIRELICAGAFTRRIWSWVCVRGPYFLKIPRVSGDRPEADLIDGATEAEQEYRLSQSLAERFEGVVDAPLRLVDGCIVKRRLTGPDLWSLAEREGATPRVRKGITEGVLFAAHLHRVDPAALPDLPMHDYAKDPYLPVPAELRDRLNHRRRTIVLSGLEVRNFKQACAEGRWLFFDPHEAVLGAPEEDFTRYVLSLLMINWGRHADCRIWIHFDYPQLLRIYETARGATLDRELLAYMFQRNTAERRFRANRAVRKLPWLTRGGGRAYERLFFWQVKRWAGRHGL